MVCVVKVTKDKGQEHESNPVDLCMSDEAVQNLRETLGFREMTRDEEVLQQSRDLHAEFESRVTAKNTAVDDDQVVNLGLLLGSGILQRCS